MSMRRTLIRGATVITLDALGDLPCADVLVTGDKITDIALRIQVDEADVVDARQSRAVGGRGGAEVDNVEHAC